MAHIFLTRLTLALVSSVEFYSFFSSLQFDFVSHFIASSFRFPNKCVPKLFLFLVWANGSMAGYTYNISLIFISSAGSNWWV
jgi:hypothetical protein